EARGVMTCSVPRSAIDRFGEQIASAVEMPRTAGDARKTSNGSKIATVEMVTELAHMRIPASEVAGLRLGDIITTETGVHSPLVVAVDGVPKFRARPGAHKGRKAVSIETRIGPPDSAT